MTNGNALLPSDAEFLDLARNTDEAHSLQVATYIRDKYEKDPLNLSISTDFECSISRLRAASAITLVAGNE